MSDDGSNSTEEATLYNPPSQSGDSVSPESAGEKIQLEIPQDLARQLLEVSMHLGLSPSIVAKRAVMMICDEIGLVQDKELSSSTLIQKYQTRIDLLHSLDYDLNADPQEGDEEPDEFGWEQVDNIINRVED